MNNAFDASIVGFDPNNIYDAYASWTDTVAKYPPTSEPFYLALGIADEAGELVMASGFVNVLKESGDVLWYCARYATRVLKVPFSSIIEEASQLPSNMNMRKAFGAIGLICGVEKKRIRDGELWDDQVTMKKRLVSKAALVDIISWLDSELADAGYTIANAIDANQGKLNDRLAAGKIRGDGDNR